MFKWVIYLTLLCITDFVVSIPDYKYNDEVKGWLKFHTVPTTFEDAFLQCHYEGAVLASPINSDFVSVISDIMSNEYALGIFIGTNALFSEGDYISMEGVPLSDMPVKWERRFDKQKPGKCLSYYYEKVSPTSCTTYLPYICYKKKTKFTRTNGCGTFDNEYFLNLAAGSCYKFHSEPRTWSEAHKVCLAEGGYLAIIDNQDEANFIRGKLPQEWGAAYIGLRKWQEDLWLTIHGQKLEKVYHNWSTDVNNKIRRLNGILLSDGSLGDYSDISDGLPFICEKDPYTSRFQTVSG